MDTHAVELALHCVDDHAAHARPLTIVNLLDFINSRAHTHADEINEVLAQRPAMALQSQGDDFVFVQGDGLHQLSTDAMRRAELAYHKHYWERYHRLHASKMDA